MLPTPARVASVARQEHRTCRRAREIRDMTRSMSRSQDCEQRSVAEDIKHPFEFPIRVLRELKFLKCGSAVEQAVFHPLDKNVLELRLLGFTGTCVNRNVPWNVRNPGDMIEMEVGHEDAFQGHSFRSNDRRSVVPDLHPFDL